jgi:hypothetical protein
MSLAGPPVDDQQRHFIVSEVAERAAAQAAARVRYQDVRP